MLTSSLVTPPTTAAHCRFFVRHLRRLGLDPLELVRELELAEDDLEGLEVELPAPRMVHFLRRARELSGDDALGLHAGEQVRLEDLDLLGLVLRSAPLGRDAFDLCREHRSLLATMGNGDLELEPQGVVCRQRPTRLASVRHWAEYIAARTVGFSRLVAGGVEAAVVRFRHAAPACTTEHRRIFGSARLEFGAEHNEVVFAAQLLGRPLPNADASVVRILSSHLARMRESAEAPPRELVKRVRSLVLAQLPQGELTLDSVARELRQSPRTLRRQLQAYGTSYQDIVDEVRRELAMRYLDEGRTAVAVSELVGFSEPTTLYRAFRRWTGQSLSAYRQASSDIC